MYIAKGIQKRHPTSTPNFSKFLSRMPSLMCTVPAASVLSLCRSRLLWMVVSLLNSGPPPRKKAGKREISLEYSSGF